MSHYEERAFMNEEMARDVDDPPQDAERELAALKENLNEATQIMDRINREMFEHAHRLPCMKALRVFLGVNDDV
jgi:hypothetical protein